MGTFVLKTNGALFVTLAKKVTLNVPFVSTLQGDRKLNGPLVLTDQNKEKLNGPLVLML